VVVRFDGSYDGRLPDRDQLGHDEAVTGPDGRFRVERYVRAGLSAWPHFRTEARVVGVLSEPHRCPAPIAVPSDRPLQIALTPALDLEDRRSSCRPVAARRGEAETYMAGWRALYPGRDAPERREQERQLARMLEARQELGFGRNCEGPVVDLAVAPGGEHVAWVERREQAANVYVAEPGAASSSARRLVAEGRQVPPQRLAWTAAGQLVLWRPSDRAARAISASPFAPGETETLWRDARALPAGPPVQDAAPALDPDDLRDEADDLWLGRSFGLARDLDPGSGLSRDRLRVTREDGSRYVIELPGEACSSDGRFGRPHYRIAAAGRVALDLRYVGDGCHAVQIDLDTGSWSRLDAAKGVAVCRAQRRIPPDQLSAALRGWTRDLDASLRAAGAEPGAAYSLRVAENGRTEAVSRNTSGEPVRIRVSRFPLSTPLRRIDVSNAGRVTPGVPLAPDPSPAGLAPL
jgi:hypothetical protein